MLSKLRIFFYSFFTYKRSKKLTYFRKSYQKIHLRARDITKKILVGQAILEACTLYNVFKSLNAKFYDNHFISSTLYRNSIFNGHVFINAQCQLFCTSCILVKKSLHAKCSYLIGKVQPAGRTLSIPNLYLCSS